MKVLLSQVILFLCISQNYAQEVVSGVFIDNKTTFNNKEFVLNGVGVREKMWIKLYVGSLYVPSKIKSEKELYAQDDYFYMRIDIVSPKITSDVLIEAIETGFKNSTNGKTGEIRERIDFLKGFFREEIVVGNVFILYYNPAEKTTSVYKNGLNLGSIEGDDFKTAFFGIWFCDQPASKPLRDKMLGN